MKTLLHSGIRVHLFFLTLILPLISSAQWGVPVNISPAATSAGLNESMGSCIGVNGNNTIHVVWTDRQSSTTGAIYYTNSQDGGLTWKNAVPISDINANAWNSAIAVNGQNIHVAWRNINGTTRSSYYTHSTDGGNTWGPVVVLDTAVANWPAVAVSGNNVYVANDIVTSVSPNNTEIFFLRSTDNGTTWSKHQQLTFAAGRSEDESITALGANVHMSWNDNRNGTMQILYKESKDFGLTWGADVVVNSEPSYGTMVWANGSNIDIPSAGAPTGRYQIHLNQSADNGTTWGPDKNLTNDPANTYYYPDMVRDGADLHLTYVKAGTGGQYLHSADGGTTWSAPFTFGASNISITPFVAYTGCTAHIIYALGGRIYYLRNPTGNAGHCANVLTLVTGTVATTLCAGNNVNVPYSAGGSYNADNTFTAQLSNANGSFANPVNIGSIASTTSGVIAAVIPLNTISGSAYRIRVISSSPDLTGNDNGSNININSQPAASIVANGPTTFCSGGSVTLVANASAGVTYQWLLNNNIISGATASTYVATLAGNYTCKITNSCGSVTSNTITVTVSSVPTATITAGGPNTFCAGGSVTLTASTGLTYQWKLNGVNISGATSPTYVVTATGSYTCLVTYSCGSATSNAITAGVITAPPATMSANGTVVCPGSAVVLKANTGVGLAYQWKLNGQNIPGATNYIDSAKVGGGYSVVVSNSCASTSSSTLTLATGSGIPATPGPITISGGSAAVCPGDLRTFTIPLTIGTMGYWTAPTGATITSGQGTSSINVSFTSAFTASGSLSVKAVNSCGYSAAQTFTIIHNSTCGTGLVGKNDEATGVDDNAVIKQGLLVYPNPALDEVTIQLQNDQEKIRTLVFSNTLGQVVTNQKFEEDNVVKVSIPLYPFAPGMYFVTVETNDKTIVERIIKQ